MENVQLKRIPVIIAYFFIADVALVSVYVANQAAGSPFFTLARLADLNGESSISTWYSVIQLACVAALAGLFASKNVNPARVSTWPLLLLPLVFVALSMDELVQIHEWLGHKSDVLLSGHTRANSLFPVTGIWMFLIGIPFIVVFLGITFILRKYLCSVPGVMTKLLLGIATFVTGAVLIETLSNFSYDSFLYHLEVVAEEGCEMLGVTIILWAFHDLLLGHGFSIHLDPVDERVVTRRRVEGRGPTTSG